MNYTILDDFKEPVIKYRKKKMRLRAIFLKLQAFKKFKSLSDLILLNSIVRTMEDLNLSFSIKEIYSVFKMVDIEDWHGNKKREILKFITVKTKNRSVF